VKARRNKETRRMWAVVVPQVRAVVGLKSDAKRIAANVRKKGILAEVKRCEVRILFPGED